MIKGFEEQITRIYEFTGIEFTFPKGGIIKMINSFYGGRGHGGAMVAFNEKQIAFSYIPNLPEGDYS